MSILKNTNSQLESFMNAQKIQMAKQLKSQQETFDQSLKDHEKKLKDEKDAFKEQERKKEKKIN